MRRKGPRDVDAPPAALALLPPWARPDVAERRASEHFRCAEELPDALALHSSSRRTLPDHPSFARTDFAAAGCADGGATWLV